MAALGKTREELQGSAMPGYIGSGIAALVSTIVLVMFIVNLDPDKAGGALTGAMDGILVAVGFAAMAMLSDTLFTGRKISLWLINTGHQVVALGVAGAILGIWR